MSFLAGIRENLSNFLWPSSPLSEPAPKVDAAFTQDPRLEAATLHTAASSEVHSDVDSMSRPTSTPTASGCATNSAWMLECLREPRRSTTSTQPRCAGSFATSQAKDLSNEICLLRRTGATPELRQDAGALCDAISDDRRKWVDWDNERHNSLMEKIRDNPWGIRGPGTPAYERVQAAQRRVGPELGPEGAERPVHILSDHLHTHVSFTLDSSYPFTTEPNGEIVMSEPFLDKLNDHSLAALLGHELAHTELEHSSAKFDELALETASSRLATERLESVVPDLAEVHHNNLAAQRQRELDVDCVGLAAATRAGYDKEKALEFWRAEARTESRELPEAERTHPFFDVRLRALEGVTAD